MGKIAFLWFPYFYYWVYRENHPSVKTETPLVFCRENRVEGFSPDLKAENLKGLSLDKARSRCPGVVSSECDDILYDKARDTYLRILAELSPLIEPAGTERCFFDLSGCRLDTEVKRLRAALACKEWGPIILGVAANKYLARMATYLFWSRQGSGIPAFHWEYVVPGREKELAGVVPLSFDDEISPRILKKLRGLGSECYNDLQELSLTALRRIAGNDALLLYRHSRGLDDEPLLGLYPPGKISCAHSFEHGVNSREALEASSRQAVQKITALLRHRKQGFRLIKLRMWGEQHSWEVERMIPWGCQEESRFNALLTPLMHEITGLIDEPVSGAVLEAAGLYQAAAAEQDLFALDRKTMEPGPDLKAIAGALRQKFPQTFPVFAQMNRREQVLALWDPWRSG